MKKILSILSILLLAATLQAGTQTKKKAVKKKTATTKSAVTTKPAEPAPVTVKKQETVAAAPTPVATKAAKQPADDFYKTAVGLKFIYGISFTAKHFINDKAALEGIIRYRHYSEIGSDFNFTGLYEYHGKIEGAKGLRWYGGGGAYINHFSADADGFGGASLFSYGVSGVLGLEYKINNLPLAISADWQPLYIINDGGGFTADNGGIGIKYTF